MKDIPMRISKLEESFLEALTVTFRNYTQHGARSSKKLVPIHGWIDSAFRASLHDQYSVHSLSSGGEKKAAGKYYEKNLDIAIMKKDAVISTLSFKFVTSNYKQNSNNYFEGLLGETANLRRANIGFAHLLVLRARTPYLKKNQSHADAGTKIEVINQHNLEKYLRLFKDTDFPHKPDVLGVVIVDIDDQGRCTMTNLNQLDLLPETKELLRNQLSLDACMEKCKALCTLKS